MILRIFIVIFYILFTRGLKKKERKGISQKKKTTKKKKKSRIRLYKIARDGK